jgi:6-phospho-beta-glucosidase
MKITVIGGGSSYTPELISGFLSRAEKLPLQELCLMDIDEKRLDVVGGLARRMAQKEGTPFAVTLTANQEQAVSGASYVITQLRVGQMQARRSDEYLGRRHGLIGQETTGIGGMAKALRTIPVILNVAEDMRTNAPGALLVNFSNPAGLITEALFRHIPDIPAVGVCNVGITTKMKILKQLQKEIGEVSDPENAVLRTLGLNHLTWHYGFTLNGRDLWPEIFQAYLNKIKQEEKPEWDINTLEILGMIPNDYLKYYYYTERMLQKQDQWPPSRAEEVVEIENRLLEAYADPLLDDVPGELMERGGAYYSTLAVRLIESHWRDLGQVFTVNTRNGGAVPGWPEDWVLELPASVGRSGIQPLPADPLPPVCYGLVAVLKMYEILTVQAAVSADRNAAYQALLAHPLGPGADRVAPVLDEMLEINRSWLPRFFPQNQTNSGKS